MCVEWKEEKKVKLKNLSSKYEMIFFYNFQASSTHSIANVFVSEILWPAQTETPSSDRTC